MKVTRKCVTLKEIIGLQGESDNWHPESYKYILFYMVAKINSDPGCQIVLFA